MSTPRRTAVSYTRFSDAKQSAGDSADRQEREYRSFCERHNLTPGKEVFADRGRSGYHGDHRTRGRLGQLIEAAKAGRFDPGTVIVIEAWDRLGRLRPDRQTELVAELLRTGVSIGVCRLNDIFTEEDFGTTKWTTLSIFIQLAHMESRQKADRVGASWEARRKRAREKGALIGTRLPAWIEVVDGKPRLIPERAAVVRKIFRWAADGLGHMRIVRALSAEDVPAFGARIVNKDRTRSQFSGRWTRPYVALLLRDRRVVGEFQAHKNNQPDGPPLVGYYPAAVSEELFSLARAAQEQRNNRDALGRRSGPRQGKYTNVFKSLLTHARDGEGMMLHNKGTGEKPELLLINTRGGDGRPDRCYTFPYLIFEEAVLGLLKELKPADVMPREGEEPSRADVLRAKLKNLRDDLANIKADLAAGYSRHLADVLRSTEAAEEAAANELQDELARTARPLEKSWEELPTLIDYIRRAPDPDAARLRLRPALRAIVGSAWLLIVARGAWRFALVQFHFVGGARRDWVIAYRPAAFRRPVRSRVLSSDAVRLPDLDLRTECGVAKAEKLLAALEID